MTGVVFVAALPAHIHPLPLRPQLLTMALSSAVWLLSLLVETQPPLTTLPVVHVLLMLNVALGMLAAVLVMEFENVVSVPTPPAVAQAPSPRR